MNTFIHYNNVGLVNLDCPILLRNGVQNTITARSAVITLENEKKKKKARDVVAKGKKKKTAKNVYQQPTGYSVSHTISPILQLEQTVGRKVGTRAKEFPRARLFFNSPIRSDCELFLSFGLSFFYYDTFEPIQS